MLAWEGHSLRFRAEVFNVANLKRFNTQSLSSPYTLRQLPSSFGTLQESADPSRG